MINKLENCEINAAIVFEQLTKISFSISQFTSIIYLKIQS